MFGYSDDEVRAVVDRLRPGMPAADADAAYARAAWSQLAEPGDRAAGLVCEAIGPARALEAVIAHAPGDRIAGASRAETAMLAEAADELAAGIERWRTRLSSASFHAVVDAAARCGARLLTPDDPEWPHALHDLGHHAPIALWVRGRLEAVAALDRSVALVGSRASSAYGETVAADLAGGAAEHGLAVTSGAAYGIDAAAHRAALALGGRTIAFLAGGVDRFYPAGNDALLARIAETGAVVAEPACGTAPAKFRFLQRNRLIAATSMATVVVEAGQRSGSLNTASHAATLGRPLGAVPGPITSAGSVGCHRLLREYDAQVITGVADLLELCGAPTPDPEPRADRTSDQVRVIDALSTRAQRTVQDIATRAGLSPAAVMAALGALDAEGAARQGERGWLLVPVR